MRTRRYHPDIRRERILKAAIVTASLPGGWSKLTRQAIAKKARCSEGLVSCYLGNMPTVRKAIMKVAIKNELVEIIAQSVAAKDGYALPRKLKNKAIIHLLNG